MPAHPHEPTTETKAEVATLSGQGVPHIDIARLLNITVPTLHKYYRDDLDRGMALANATVSGRLFAMTETNVAAAIFWTKVRMGWSERQQVEVTGKDGGPVQHSIDASAAVGALMSQLAAAKAGGAE